LLAGVIEPGIFPRIDALLGSYSVLASDNAAPRSIMGIFGALSWCWVLW